jgi:hypothetical protein
VNGDGYITLLVIGAVVILLFRSVGTRSTIKRLAARAAAILPATGGGATATRGTTTYPWFVVYPVVVAVIGVMILFFVLSSPLWVAGYQIAGGPQWWLLLLATVAIAAVAMVTQGVTRVVLLGVTIGILALVLIVYLIRGLANMPECVDGDTACREAIRAEEIAKAERQAVLEAARERALSTSDRCPGEHTSLPYSSREVVNPNFCQVRWWVESGCVQWFDSRGNKLGRPTCANDERNITGQYALESVGEPAVVSITLCEKRATGNQLETCS